MVHGMIVSDSTWLKYTIGITCLAYLMVHGVWDDMLYGQDTCQDSWLIYVMVQDWCMVWC